ncbi:hypothetical protein EW026_g6443 [Hermanssonia centrifuga]|uniref:FAD/NAD(P)-binding domain-containing protein n=1 Tax=Hermanssonia centrifuga TaxID=98765 RepID=A0A4S4KBB5_9APHY|nr:hypothetical protein EW026_g6443 [Hermanssonia centrifuga]
MDLALLRDPSPFWLLGVSFVSWILYKLAGKLVHAYLVKRLLTVDGLPLLGVQRGKKIKGTAVICGGSISGLLSARVCADHFTDVLIIDPELAQVERTKASTRIAQYDSLHGYLTFVLDGMRRLWPNFDNELQKVGGHIAPGDVKPYFSGILIPAPYTEYEAKSQPLPETMFIRRPQLENLLRRLVLGFRSNVRTLVGTVRGLEAKQGPTARISAIIVRTGNGEISIKDPTMVVDCSGDSQAGFKWLKKCGYEMPADVRLEYDQKLYYVTITFSVSEDMKKSMPIPGGYEQAGWLYTFVPQPKLTSAGFVLGKMDNDTMQLCCGGWGDVNLPLEADDIESPVRGESLDSGAFGRWYLDVFIDAAMKDSELASVMWHVRMLKAPPTDMFTPSVLWKLGKYLVQSHISHRIQ